MKLNENIDELINDYFEIIKKEERDINRIKKFYNDDESFDFLMNRIVQKDLKRFKLIFNETKNLPNPWRVLYIILNIVHEEGKYIEPFDYLTKQYDSLSIYYHGWVFSWVHGKNTLISIFNPQNELVYRF